jgi:hypothetical protein
VLRHSDSCSAASVARLLGRPFCGMGVSSWVPPNADLQAVVEMTFKGAGRFAKRALTRHLWEISYFSVCYSVPQNVETVEVAIFLLYHNLNRAQIEVQLYLTHRVFQLTNFLNYNEIMGGYIIIIVFDLLSLITNTGPS